MVLRALPRARLQKLEWPSMPQGTDYQLTLPFRCLMGQWEVHCFNTHASFKS